MLYYNLYYLLDIYVLLIYIKIEFKGRFYINLSPECFEGREK